MDPELLVFYVLAAVGTAAAALMVTRKNLVHSALYLVVTFFAVAAIYVLLGAEFIAAVQVFVYAGGIMVLFLFVILLVDLPRELATGRTWRKGHVVLSALLTALMVCTLGFYLSTSRPPSSGAAPVLSESGNLETVALTLFRHYVLPFEVVSLLLMVAMVGAILLARTRA